MNIIKILMFINGILIYYLAIKGKLGTGKKEIETKEIYKPLPLVLIIVLTGLSFYFLIDFKIADYIIGGLTIFASIGLFIRIIQLINEGRSKLKSEK